jgi:serine/threonine-protein kinase
LGRLPTSDGAKGAPLGPIGEVPAAAFVLADRYEIEQELGRGGMGRVLVALDHRLGRRVAIKMLAAGAHSESALQRFELEARAAGSLNHPNILDVHDVGVWEGEPYIVSELLEGETLSERIRRGKLSPQEALRCAVQLADGLAAAHDKGIIHRDLKPENIFLGKDGRLKILDFGIAKLVDRGPNEMDEARASRPKTETGAILGTIGYMSPEQIRGQPVDERSDIFSCGMIFYEMVAGRSPFGRPTTIDTGYAILNDHLPDLPDEVPAPFAELVQHCSEKKPADRFQSAHALLANLKRLASVPSRSQTASDIAGMFKPLLLELKRRRVYRALIAYGVAAFAVLQIVEPVLHGMHWPDSLLTWVVMALAAGLPVVLCLAWIFDVNHGRIERTSAPARELRGARLMLLLLGISVLAAAPGVVWYFAWRSGGRSVESTLPPSIAVLPFVNLSSDKENEYFSDGMTEELISALTNVEGLRVVARTSVFSFKGKNENVRKIGEELKVATVLEGSVRREGNRLRLTVQLVSAADGYHLWSRTYDRELKNVFAVEDELARAIVLALRPKILPSGALVREPTPSIEAHDLYLKGRYLWNQRTKEGMAKAIAAMEGAIAIDPDYALAQSGLADCYSLFIDYGGGRAAELLPKAKAHALKAVELNEALGEGHASLAAVSEHDYDWNTAEREIKRAIELRPGYATAHQWYAEILWAKGRLPEALAEAQRARELDPTSPAVNYVLAITYFIMHDYDRAIAQATRTLELDPGFVPARVFLVLGHVKSGRLAEAMEALDQARANTDMLKTVRAQVLLAKGDRAEAQRLVAEAEAGFAIAPFPRAGLAGAHLSLGDTEGAFSWLERGVEARDPSLPSSVKWASIWDPVRSDPRFQRLLQRMNLQ